MQKIGQYLLFTLLITVYCFSVSWYEQSASYKKVSYEITDANKADLNVAHFKVEFYTSPAAQNSTINIRSLASFYKEVFSEEEFAELTNNQLQKDRYYSYLRFSYSFITLFSVTDIIFPFHYFW
jgi:nicotinic acid phosphoribosyltransferase